MTGRQKTERKPKAGNVPEKKQNQERSLTEDLGAIRYMILDPCPKVLFRQGSDS